MAHRPQDEYAFSIRNLQSELNRVFDKVFTGGGPMSMIPGMGSKDPAIDLYEFKDRFVLLADVPGVTGDKIELSYLDGKLTLRGDVPVPFAEDEQGRSVRTERRVGVFQRSIELPASIDPDAITAKCREGLLEVTLNKSASASPKAVKVDNG